MKVLNLNSVIYHEVTESLVVIKNDEAFNCKAVNFVLHSSFTYIWFNNKSMFLIQPKQLMCRVLPRVLTSQYR